LDLKQLGAGLRTIAMLIMQDFVWSRVSKNHGEGVATWCYFDEFHMLLRDELTASYCVTIWKMLRKKGCVPSALTQNVKDLLASREVENILENTDFMILLSQAQGDRQILAKQLGISPHQLSYITHSNSGEGLLFFAGDSGDYGLVVVLDDGEGLVSKYAHCSALLVSAGQTVQAGDVIAKVGNTGNSTGPHLHLEVIKDGQYLNPLYFAVTNDYGQGPTYGANPGAAMGDGTFAAMLAEA